MFDLTGKAALVTGGNSGIGEAMARGLASAGASVAIAGRNQQKNNAVASQLAGLGVRTIAVEVDVQDDESCRAMIADAVQGLGRLDILVNNAGINIRKAPQSYTLEEWHRIIQTNLTSVFVASLAAYPHMQRAGGGKIINIGSMLSIFGANFAAPYAASKGGVVQLTKSLATSWGRDNIQVNAVLPGNIETPLTVQAKLDVEGHHERVLARTPAARWGVPEDLAGIAVFLASRESDFVTGAAIPVDGGYSAQG